MVSLVPLTLRLQIYSSLGWVDKVDAINAAIEKTRGHHEFAGELG
jgi:peptidoglycan hydrolase-like amidase